MSVQGAVRQLSIVVVIALAAGCATTQQHPHVQLERAPSVDEPFDARAKYFKEHALSAVEPDHLFLHGGTRVYWPEDLLPAIDTDSPTAKAIKDHVEARERIEEWQWMETTSNGLFTVGSLAMLGGLGGVLVPLAVPESADIVYPLSIGALIGGGVVALAGLGTLYTYGAIVGEDAQSAGEAADRAKKTYPQSLSDRLGVGVDANGLIIDYVKPSAPPAPESDDGRDI